MSKIIFWRDPPPMETGSPLPAARAIGNRLLVAYVCSNPEFPGWNAGAELDHPGFAVYCAVLEFSGVKSFKLGPPSDERLWEHPLYRAGLKSYEFHEIQNESSQHSKHWIVTFHDETLDVIAEHAKILETRIEGEDTHAILAGLE
jgi:hypothetical protein